MIKALPFKISDEISTKYGRCIVTEYISKMDIKVKFVDTGFEAWTNSKHLRSGSVKDWLAPSVFGVGIVGRGKYKTAINKEITREYRIWSDMLKRCYCPSSLKKVPAYEAAEVSLGMKLYQDFAEWCQTQKGFGLKGWQLDKDILNKGNKLYDFDLCVFVPREINNLFTKRDRFRGEQPLGVYKQPYGNFSATVSVGEGKAKYLGMFKTEEEAFLAYKTEKEMVVKSLAEKWKELVDPRVYEALVNYKVDIND